MKAIEHDFKILAVNKPIPTNLLDDYINLIYKTYFLVNKLNDKKRELLDSSNQIINKYTYLFPLNNRLEREKIIKSLFYVMPIKLIKNG